jgi:hypothetical protein
MARHVSDPANSTDIELRGERDSNEMTKQDTQFPDLAGSRMQASTTEKDDNAAHSSSLMLSIRQNLRAKLAATAERKASTETAESYPMRRLGDLKSSKRSTRFDDDSIEEEPQMVHQEEKPKEVTQEFLLDSTASKWKQFAERSRAQAKETRLVESYQFFTTSFLEEEEEEAEVNSLEVTDGQRAANEESTQEEQLREGEGEQDDTHSRDALIEELERIGEEDSPAPETYGIVSSAATE